MAAYYIRFVVYTSFPVLYRVLSEAFGHHYRRCLKLVNGNLFGIILGGRYPWEYMPLDVTLSITLEEKEGNEVVVEAFSYVGARKVKAPPRIDKRCVREVLKIVDKLGFTYRILDEIDYFTLEQVPYNPDKLFSETEIRKIQVLPKNIRNLIPCPFLNFDFSQYYLGVYVCRVAELLGYSSYKLLEKDVLNRCVEYRYLECPYYLEGSKKEKELERSRKFLY